MKLSATDLFTMLNAELICTHYLLRRVVSIIFLHKNRWINLGVIYGYLLTSKSVLVQIQSSLVIHWSYVPITKRFYFKPSQQLIMRAACTLVSFSLRLNSKG